VTKVSIFHLLSLALPACVASHLENHLALTVTPNGSFSITSTSPAWTFAGSVGAPIGQISENTGSDSIGFYRKTSFAYTLNGIPASSSIRVYAMRPVALFSTTLLAATPNTPLFPRISSYPQGLYQFGFKFTYLYQFGGNAQGPDSPWAWFDASGNTFIISPASHFPLAWTTEDQSNAILAGIRPDISTLPAGFTQDTMLVVSSGINHTWDLWGRALTDLAGKTRPSPDSDISLSTLSYWTDSVSHYYYNFVPALGYEGTLAAIQQNLANDGLPIGSMQLDSWWYPKGNPPAWNNNGDGLNYGQYLLRPDPTILPDGLSGVRNLIGGIPLLVHSRWIDPSSPIRQQYQMSGNVPIDPQYWSDLAAYLAANGVMTYEQDWLAGYAQSNINVSDPETYLDEMANSMAAAGITVQYCGHAVGQIMQGSRYNNLTTARVSPDGFNSTHWDPFLYNSRLVSALGIFPFADNVYSSDVMSLALETNSAGMVGIGDAIGSEVPSNLAQVVRPDGIIVKPDTSMVPLDSTYIADAQSAHPPMVAFSSTARETLTAAYVFAYSRNPDGSAAAIQFKPADLGIEGSVYVFNYFAKTGAIASDDSPFTDSVPPTGAYYIVAPIGRSGIALFGDSKKFAALGRQRFPSIEDSGALAVSIQFAAGEPSVTIQGYSPKAPAATFQTGSITARTYDPGSEIFTLTVSPSANQSTVVLMLAQ